ncbi:membrane associated ring-CH-type finger 4b [Salmo salar]|uniref:RING-type E3 ubiquitin transferase n=1 Tax=Salmo salar TaxID=8030 RepID=A0ABM3DNH8_SALSA|nr:membrane associated ring-CH-type finger 4 [Salmo salar]
MLRGLDMLKSRCCVLFGDLKVLLLRTPTPVSIPTTGHIPDSHVVPSEVSVPDNNTLTAHEGQRDVWTAPPPGAANGPERDRLSGWVDAAATEPSEVLHCSGSSDSWAKDKLEQRFSLCSYSESGSIRTPVCRICFQGPETGELLSPCRCSGSVRCTHQPCLIKWISERGSWACELCYYKYQVISISTRNPLQVSCYHASYYDKATDSEDLKTAATVRTLSQPQSSQRNQPGTGLGLSSAAAATATASPAAGIGLITQGSTEQAGGTAGPDQHCAAYNILQLLSHLRQPEAHGHPSHSTRELVMRVTTV